MDDKKLEQIVSFDAMNGSWVVKCPSCGKPLFGFPADESLNKISDFLVKNNDNLKNQIPRCPQCLQELSYNKVVVDNKD
jgi:uncharacterized protein with PIN domain